jgi:hypothetical protein
MNAIFRRHGCNLRFEWQLRDGTRKSVAFAENSDCTVKTDAFVTYPPDPDLLGWHAYLRTRSKLGFPCLICGEGDNVEMHHVRHVRKLGLRKPRGFQAVMRALNRKQIPVCKGCHRKIHLGEYDGIACTIWLTISPHTLHSLGLESRMPRNGACPVREGAVGFPS